MAIVADERRAALLDRLADHVLAHGLTESSLRPLAAAANTSDRMLLYYFKDKPAVIAATLEHVANRLGALLAARTTTTPRPIAMLRDEIVAVLFADDLWPYMRLWLEIASRSASGDPVCRTVGEAIARGFLAWGAAQLDSDTPARRATEAATLMVGVEGRAVLKSLGLDDVCALAR